MIDWLSITTSALWIVGSAIALATISYAYWEAQTRGEKLGGVLGRTRVQTVLNVAALLFCLGQLGSVSEAWERALWGILAIAFAAQAIAQRHMLKDDRPRFR